MKALSHEQADSYRYNGFLFPLPALTPEEIATCLAGLDRLETELGRPVADADLKWRSHAYAHSPWFNNLIRHPRILDAVEDPIGPNILVWTSTFFIKEPHSPTFAAWHQDATYFGLEPKESVCAWVALTDADHEAGCMEALSSRGAPAPASPRGSGPGEQHQPRRPDHRGEARRIESRDDVVIRRVFLPSS
jgi:non-heme Fe2+,alpha-ketoglutarate-dependent halogenase